MPIPVAWRVLAYWGSKTWRHRPYGHRLRMVELCACPGVRTGASPTGRPTPSPPHRVSALALVALPAVLVRHSRKPDQ